MLGLDVQQHVELPDVAVLNAQLVPLDVGLSRFSFGVEWVRATATDVDVEVGTWVFSFGQLLDAYANWWVPVVVLIVVVLAARSIRNARRKSQRRGLTYCRLCNYELEPQNPKMCPECGPKSTGLRPVQGRTFLRRTGGWFAALFMVVMLAGLWQVARIAGYNGFFSHLPLHSRWVAKQIDQVWGRLPDRVQRIADESRVPQYDYVRLTNPDAPRMLFRIRKNVMWNVLSDDGRELRFAEFRPPGLLSQIYSVRQGAEPIIGPQAILGGWLTASVWDKQSGQVAMIESAQSRTDFVGFVWNGSADQPVRFPPLMRDEIKTLDGAGDDVALAFIYAKRATDVFDVRVIGIAGDMTRLEVDPQLVGNATRFGVSADGTTIVFVRGGELVRAHVSLAKRGRVQMVDRLSLPPGTTLQFHKLSRDGRLSVVMTTADQIFVFDWHKGAVIGQTASLALRSAAEGREADLSEDGDIAITADLSRVYFKLSTSTTPPVPMGDLQFTNQLYSIDLPPLAR